MSNKLRQELKDVIDEMTPEEIREQAREMCKISTQGDKIITKQEFKEDVNINTIMGKVRKGQVIDPAQLSFDRVPRYGDFSEVPDLMAAHEIVNQVAKDFEQLPSEVKKKFQNDARKVVEYLSDEKNNEESYELGLRVRPEPEPIVKVEVTNPEPPPAE